MGIGAKDVERTFLKTRGIDAEMLLHLLQKLLKRDGSFAGFTGHTRTLLTFYLDHPSGTGSNLKVPLENQSILQRLMLVQEREQSIQETKIRC